MQNTQIIKREIDLFGGWLLKLNWLNGVETVVDDELNWLKRCRNRG
jgi:hypothetical protein